MNEGRNEYKITMLDVDQILRMQPVYQRKLSEADINRYAREWDIRLCDPIRVARYPDGQVEIVDGQHRAHAFKRKFDKGKIHCYVATVQNREDAADWFVKCNTERRLLSGGDLTEGKKHAGHEPTLIMLAMCEHFKIELANGAARTQPGVLSCRGALIDIVERHGELRLKRVLRVVAEAWRNYAFFQKTHWVLALNAVFESLEKNPDFNEDAIVKKLKAMPPEKILSQYDVPGRPATASVPRARDAILKALA